jgi:putative methyltransferase (TIGR04325 family)
MATGQQSRDAATSLTSTLKQFAKSWIPPALWCQLRYLRHGDEALYEYLGPYWPKDAASETGWDDAIAVETMRAHWSDYRRMAEGTAPWDRRPWGTNLSDQFAFNDQSAFAFAVALAARARPQVSVLDWGGAFGHYALIAKTVIPSTSIDYTVKERQPICIVGAELNPGVSFTSDDVVAFSRQYDLVVAAGSLQYSPDWRETSNHLAASAKEWLLVAQLPITDPAHRSFVAKQRLRRIGIAADSICWIIDLREFLDRLHKCGFVLVREFLSAPARRVIGGGANSTSTTLLLRRN